MGEHHADESLRKRLESRFVRVRKIVRGHAAAARSQARKHIILAILFLGPAHDDPERIVRQRSLQRLRFIPWCPHVPLFVGRQDHRHGLRMDRLDHRVRRCREKTIDLMRPRHRLRLRAAITIERRPDASESEQRAVIVECEPNDILFLGLRVWLRSVFGEAVGRDKAPAFRLEPARQCGDEVLRMLVTGGPPVRGGGGMPQRIMVSSRSSPGLLGSSASRGDRRIARRTLCGCH